MVAGMAARIFDIEVGAHIGWEVADSIDLEELGHTDYKPGHNCSYSQGTYYLHSCFGCGCLERKLNF